MQVQKIFHSSTQKNSKSSNVYQNNPLSKQYLNVSFKGEEDSFSLEKTEILLRKVQDDLKKIRLDILAPVEYESPRDEMLGWENIKGRMAIINTQYEMIDRAMHSSPNKNLADEKTKAILKFIQAMTRLKKDEGLGRIVGTTYKGIKQDLIDKFVLQTVGKAKISDDVKVPNALFFYGPPGTGKTTFAKALAEQSCSNIDVVHAGKVSPEEALAQIKQKALMAKANYEQSGADKKRTFIVVNEADAIAAKGGNTTNNFIRFVQDCSNKYKCTLFLTTNKPLNIDSEILSNKVTPIKVALMPADKQTAKEITEYTLKRFNQPIEHADKMVEAFLGNPNALYSHANIIKTIEDAYKESSGIPSINDLLKGIQSRTPSIPKKILSTFPKNNAELMEMVKRIR